VTMWRVHDIIKSIADKQGITVRDLLLHLARQRANSP